MKRKGGRADGEKERETEVEEEGKGEKKEGRTLGLEVI